MGADPATSGIFLRSIDDSADLPSKLLVRASFNARLVTDRDKRGAWLLYLNGDTLTARRLDVAKLELTGPAFTLPARVGTAYQTAVFSASTETLVYRTGVVGRLSRLVWMDSSGKDLGVVGEPGQFEMSRPSPDETKVAFIRTEPGGQRDVWVLDLARGSTARVTFGDRTHDDPVWSPDSRELAFGARGAGSEQIFRKRADGSGDEALVLAVPNQAVTPMDWSSDGRYLLYEKSQTVGFVKTNIGVVPMTAGVPPLTVESNEKFFEGNPTFSPDGRYVTYDSNDTGRREVYVRSLYPEPGATAKWLISTSGGHNPQFSADGKRLYWVQAPLAWEADIDTAPSFRASAPRRRFNFGNATGGATIADSKGRALFIRPDVQATADEPIQVMVNWESALRSN